MHDSDNDRHGEEEALDRVMTSIDPILQASLQREQKRRRHRMLLMGGSVMGTCLCIAIFALTMAGGDPQAPTASGQSATDRVLQSERAATLSQEGWRLWQSRQPVDAEAKFEEAAQLDPQDANIWNGLGWSRIHQGKFEEAAEAFGKCLEINGEHGGARNGAGQSQLMLRNYDQAEKLLEQASKTAPAALYPLARVRLLTADYAGARKVLDQLTKQDTGQLDRRLLAEMRAACRKKSLSPSLRQRLEPPESAGGDQADVGQLNARGWQLFSSGKARPAELAFREALEIKPDHLPALNGLAFSLINQGKAKEAKPIFERFLKESPEHPGGLNGLARCHVALGEPEQAIPLWKIAEGKMEGVNASTWGLARTLTDLRKYDEALVYWERIAKSQPNDPHVEEQLEKCREASRQ